VHAQVCCQLGLKTALNRSCLAEISDVMSSLCTSELLIVVCVVCCCEGQALVEAGESYRQLAEVKYAMEDNVKQNFLDPLAHIQNKDLKEVNVSC